MVPSTPPDRLRPGLLFRWGALFSLGAGLGIVLDEEADVGEAAALGVG